MTQNLKEGNSPFSLKYLPLLIQLECCEAAELPSYLGSTIHGVLGWALSSNSRVYTYLFENRKYGGGKQDIINPYLIELTSRHGKYKEGDILRFKLILLGDSIQAAEDVIQVLIHVNKFVLGASRKLFRLTSILHGERFMPIWQDGVFEYDARIFERLEVMEQLNYSRCSIQMVTPLRIRRGGELLLNVDFPTIIRNITKRVSMLTERYGGYVDNEHIQIVLEQASNIVVRSSDLYIANINRYSTRRDGTMDMSGLLGAMTCEGELALFAPWLLAARKLHIGRNTTFGYGQLEVVFG